MSQGALCSKIQEGSDVEIEHPVHTLRHQGLFEGRQGRVGAPSRPEAITEAQKIGLVDGVQHLGHRPLDNFVLKRGYAERPLATVASRDIRAAHRLGPVLPAVDPVVQMLKIALQRLLVSHPPTRLLCTLRRGRRLPRRNTRYRAGATRYPDRTFTGWNAPAFLAHQWRACQ